nr:hypothetical protein [Tanacetum cinerariifolium]
MENKKRIVNLEYFREMLHICPRLPGQTFDELPFEEEILAFLRFLGHSREIRKLTDVNINKLHQPWRSFTAKNVDFAYLMWEDFVYQVEHKDAMKSNEMYYPRFIKVIIHYFMTKDPSIPKRNKFGVMLPVELTNGDIKNSEAYKEYYAIVSGAAPPKTKASVRKTKSSLDTTITPLTVAGTRLLTSTKGKQPAMSTKAKDEGTGTIPGFLDVPTDESDDEISWKSSDEEGNDKDDEGNDDASLGLNVGKEGQDAEDDDEELYRDVNIKLEGQDVQMTYVHTIQEYKDTHVTLTPVNPNGQQQNVQASTTIAPLTLTTPTLPPPTIPTISQLPQAPTPLTTAPSTLLQDLPNFGSLFGFDYHLKTLEASFSEFVQTNQFAGAVAYIHGIVERYMDQRMNEAQQSIHRFNEQKNLYKALVDAYESDKIILDTYRDTITLKRCRDDADKDEEPFVGSDRGSKRQREGKEPESTSAPKEKATKTTGKSTQGIQPWISDLAKQADSRSSFNELMDTPVDFLAFLMNRLKIDTLTPELLAGPTYELMKGSCKSLVKLEFFLEEVYKATTDQLDWNNSEGHRYLHNLLKPPPLIPNSRGRRLIPFDHFIKNELEYLRGGTFSRKYTTFVTKTKAANYGHIKWIEDLFYGFAVNRESARDVYSKRRIIAVTELQIVEWYDYKHLDWIMVRRDDDKLYKFKEGNFKRLRIQDIEDMLLLLVQKKLTNFTVEERFAFNVSLRMFTKSIVIQRHVEDLQLGVESYQKNLNLTKPDMYPSDLKRKEAYTAYSNLRGFIYHNIDKQNRLMQINELYEFSDGTLNDVRTALDDHLKGIRIKYLPQAIWRKNDKERAAAMIQTIDKQLKTRRIMQSLEKFIGGRLYEGDFRMLQRTI